MNAFFITGTGTGVGKTRFAGLLAKLSVEAGLKTALMKPVQTGVLSPEAGDLEEARKAAPGLMRLPPSLACPYCLRLEASPHLAAMTEDMELDLRLMLDAFERIKNDFKPDTLIVEGAGGVCVPLSRELAIVDLIRALRIPAIVVSLSGLGAINHTLLTLKELRRNSVPVAGVVLNRMPQVPTFIELDNARTIERLGGAPILATLPESSIWPPEGLPDTARLTALLKLE